MMSSDQFQPERDFPSRRESSPRSISGRAWVKRDLEFWHRCTLEKGSVDGITVSLDNMDELTVDFDHVSKVELEPGDLVFMQHWDGAISGIPGFVIAVKGEIVEVEFPESLYGKAERHTCFLRELRFYDDL